MNSQVDWATVSDAMANHLPALWVVAAAVLGASAVSALVPKPPEALSEIALGVTAVTPEVIREFPLEIGTVTRVIDGDTYDVQLDRTGDVVRGRLAWVDTPETNQPFGAEATQWAENTLHGRQVVLTAQDVDAYGRLVAELTVNGDDQMWDTASTLLRSGLGWVDHRFAKDRDSLREDQELAAGEGTGLWSAPSPTPPWEWRDQGGERKQSAAALAARDPNNPG